jgi:hypothetical protein
VIDKHVETYVAGVRYEPRSGTGVLRWTTSATTTSRCCAACPAAARSRARLGEALLTLGVLLAAGLAAGPEPRSRSRQPGDGRPHRVIVTGLDETASRALARRTRPGGRARWPSSRAIGFPSRRARRRRVPHDRREADFRSCRGSRSCPASATRRGSRWDGAVGSHVRGGARGRFRPPARPGHPSLRRDAAREHAAAVRPVLRIR